MAPRDSSGDYTLPVNDWNPAVEGTVVDQAGWNDTADDFATTNTDSLSRTGLGGMEADLAMGAHGVVVTEQSSVSSPASNTVILYGKDVAGQTHLFGKTQNGTDIDIMAGAGIGGTVGVVDNALTRADGTGGGTLQGSPIIVTDAGNMSGVGTLAAGNTTITGTAAISGALTNGGVAVLNVGASGVAGQTIVSGYALTIFDYGNKAAGSTITVDPSLGQHQKATLTSTGSTAVTILAPSVEADCILKILNNSGGTVTTPTFSGFDKVLTGSNAFSTANGKINWIFIYNVDGFQAYTIQNMN